MGAYRDDIDDLDDGLANMPPSSGTPTPMACTITSDTTPFTSPQVFYHVTPLLIGGPETEGQPIATAPASGKFLAANLGTKIPDAGTEVIVYPVPNRHVFFFNG